MAPFFAEDWVGDPFQLFGTGHLIFLTVFILINFSFIWLGKSSNQGLKDSVRFAIV